MRALTLLCLILLNNLCYAKYPSVDYSKVAESGSHRMDNYVTRYIRLYEDPCLYVQVLDPQKKWKILSSVDICELNGKRFFDEFADASFIKQVFEGDMLNFTLDTVTLIGAVNEVYSCSIKVDRYEIQPMSCSLTKRLRD